MIGSSQEVVAVMVIVQCLGDQIDALERTSFLTCWLVTCLLVLLMRKHFLLLLLKQLSAKLRLGLQMLMDALVLELVEVSAHHTGWNSSSVDTATQKFELVVDYFFSCRIFSTIFFVFIVIV